VEQLWAPVPRPTPDVRGVSGTGSFVSG
jgi:hypothetical protein